MPTIAKVTVSASSGFNHPHEQFANFKPSISLEAELEVGDDYYKVVRKLQEQVETLVQSHKQAILDDLERIKAIEEAKTNLEFAQQQQKRHQDNSETVERFQRALDELLGQRATQPVITQGDIIGEPHWMSN